MSEFSVVWICIEISGVRNSLSPFTGEANFTPSSLILRISPRLQTWKPPESVRIGLSHCSKRCRPPNCCSTSRPGCIHRRSEEHTSELQSRGHLVCRLLLEKKKA